jgi:hypothetical protein
LTVLYKWTVQLAVGETDEGLDVAAPIVVEGNWW